MREHIRGIGRIADSGIFKYRRVVDAIPIYLNHEIAHVGRNGINAPWNCNQFGLAGHASASAAGG